MMEDRNYMQRAISISLKGKGRVSPNPMVGAIIVKNNKIIAEGWHQRCGADHAEIAAFKKKRDSLKGACLYVTLEPCFHIGRTLACVDEIIRQDLKRVVIGMKDPNPLTNGKSIRKLKQAGVEVSVGLLKKEILKSNEFFVKYIKYKMPFIAAKTAQTLDGKIATAQGQSKWITTQESRNFARRVRDEYDAILVGINTILADNPSLSAGRRSKRIKKVVLDSSLLISDKAKIFEDTNLSDCIVVTTEKSSKIKREKLAKKGISVIVAPKMRGQIDLLWLFKELAKNEITSILIEGGAHVIGTAFKEKLVDKIYTYIAPKILGDRNALSSVIGVNIVDVNKAIDLENLTIKKINKDVMMEAYVFRNN